MDVHRLTAPRVEGVMTVLGRAHPPDGTEGSAEGTWRAVLSGAELRRADAFSFDTDRREFQYTRWLLRTELSRLAPVAPGEWEFVFSRNGKPAIHPRFASDIEFSLSHSGGLCLIGLAHGRPVGVDVQICDALDNPESVGRLFTKCLSPEERADVEPLAGLERRDAVIQLWALKEAYAKAVGLGVRLPFAQISLRPDGHGRTVLRPTARVPDPGRWDCHAPQAPTGFRIGVCVAAPAAPVRLP
ncbi:4'-phosphopantetheinyl transferase family protein [Streptomyces cyaneofuscatus]